MNPFISCMFLCVVVFLCNFIVFMRWRYYVCFLARACGPRSFRAFYSGIYLVWVATRGAAI